MPTAVNIVTFAVVGAGAEIIGTGNGDPQSHTPDKSLTREAFRGLVLAVVQSTPGAPSASDGAGSTPWVTVRARLASRPAAWLSTSPQRIRRPWSCGFDADRLFC